MPAGLMGLRSSSELPGPCDIFTVFWMSNFSFPNSDEFFNNQVLDIPMGIVRSKYKEVNSLNLQSCVCALYENVHLSVCISVSTCV